MHTLPETNHRERINFSKISTTVPIPNLIEIQKKFEAVGAKTEIK